MGGMNSGMAKRNAMASNDLTEPSTEAEEIGPPIDVVLRRLSGETTEVKNLQSTTSLLVLRERAAEQLGLKKPQVQLGLGEHCWGQEDLNRTMQELGVVHGAELLLVIRKANSLLDPVGRSRYNGNYYCEVLRVEEVADNTLELDFEVFGNMSLGRLQDPRHSSLGWKDGEEDKTCSPSSFVFKHEDFTSRIKGTLTFVDVLINRHVHFRFGSSGYSWLKIDFDD